jgi:hypothetical protein
VFKPSPHALQLIVPAVVAEAANGEGGSADPPNTGAAADPRRDEAAA